MNNQVSIIGSGSKLYKSIKSRGKIVVINEYRTREVLLNKSLIKDDEVYIVFSLLTYLQLQNLFENTTSKVIVIGSCSALSSIANKFRYSRLKKEQLDFIINNDKENLKCILFGDFKLEEKRRGLQYVSCINDFWSDILEAIESNDKVIKAYKITGEKNFIFHLLSIFDKFLAPVSTLLIKKATNYNYGYSNPLLSKRLK
jgi:hypothetical protein